MAFFKSKIAFNDDKLCVFARAIICLVIVTTHTSFRMDVLSVRKHNENMIVNVVFSMLNHTYIICVIQSSVRKFYAVTHIYIYCCGLVQMVSKFVFHNGNNDAMEWTMKVATKKRMKTEILFSKNLSNHFRLIELSLSMAGFFVW